MTAPITSENDWATLIPALRQNIKDAQGIYRRVRALWDEPPAPPETLETPDLEAEADARTAYERQTEADDDMYPDGVVDGDFDREPEEEPAEPEPEQTPPDPEPDDDPGPDDPGPDPSEPQL
ncbi:hypothetical protein AB0M43_23740 [Longispora sp. NPDC051575]|uniref:hypothetical protein n=1 Tax=Longispora sp. NPDC051575 TaxID=3154943 RepID=UPI0034414163